MGILPVKNPAVAMQNVPLLGIFGTLFKQK